MRVRGTNQHKVKERIYGLRSGTWLSINAVSILILPVILFGHQAAGASAALADTKLASPLPQSVNVVDIQPSQPPLAPLSEREANIAIIKKIWGSDWQTGAAIAKCESGLRSNAVNRHNTDGSVDAGLFQINSIHQWSEVELLDPIANAGIAYAMFAQQGLNPWSSSAHCWKGEL